MGNLYKNVHFIIIHTGSLIGWSIIYRFWYFFLSRIHKIHDLFPKKASKQQWTLNFFGGRVFILIVLYKMRGVLFKMCEIHRHMALAYGLYWLGVTSLFFLFKKQLKVLDLSNKHSTNATTAEEIGHFVLKCTSHNGDLIERAILN